MYDGCTFVTLSGAVFITRGREIMLRNTLHIREMLLVVTSGALLASCGTMQPSALQVANAPTVEVVVGGKPQLLAAFNQAFQPLIATEPVGCNVNVTGQVSDCSVLQGTTVPPTATALTYDYFGAHAWVFEKLGVAFNQVQSQFPAETLTMTTSPTPPLIVPDCSSLPPPCTSTPWCNQYGGCSKQRFPCAKC